MTALDLPPLAFDRPEAAPVRSLAPEALTEIAAGLARSADAWTDRLDRDPQNRTGVRLVATDLYDVWLLRWPVCTSVTPHDHGDSTGVFTVVSGELTELLWEPGRGDAGPVERRLGRGETAVVVEGAVHDVIAKTVESVSVHVYSPPLTEMTYYTDDGASPIGRTWVDDHPLGETERY